MVITACVYLSNGNDIIRSINEFIKEYPNFKLQK